MSKKFRVGIVARMKQGDLLEALIQRNWSQSDAARFLGISPTTFGHWINMTGIPKSFTAEMTIKLFELTGKTTEELFPEFVRDEEFRSASKVRRVTFEADPDRMLGSRELLRLEAPPEMTPDGRLSALELKESINSALRGLTPREEKLVRDVILSGLDPQEIAKRDGVTQSRVRQIVAKGLNKLREPELVSILKPHL